MAWELHEHRLERLRQRRVKPARDVALTPIISDESRLLRRTQKALAGIAAAWDQSVPAELAGRTVLVSLARGVLTVRVRDAAARFALDRFLRNGGEQTLIHASSTSVRKVKVVIQ